ncbi:MAG: hypothetical protein JWO10_816, partial [Microbacteriaceae bacterium]|nr:hypothetical protein [Microbacteriaceae bacterium]
WIAIALLVVLVVQGAYTLLAAREPFPNVSMPSFAVPTLSRTGHIHVAEPGIQIRYADGTRRAVLPERFMAPMDISESRFTIDYLFRPDDAHAPVLTPATIQWMKKRTEDLSASKRPVGLEFSWVPIDLDVDAVAGTPVGPAVVREVTW